jgi:hypothetical protein
MRLNRCRYFRGYFAGTDLDGKLRWTTRKPIILDHQTSPTKASDFTRPMNSLRQRVEMLRGDSAIETRMPLSPLQLERFKFAAYGFCVLAAKQEELRKQDAQPLPPDKRKELRLQLARLERSMQHAVEEIAQMLR